MYLPTRVLNLLITGLGIDIPMVTKCIVINNINLIPFELV